MVPVIHSLPLVLWVRKYFPLGNVLADQTPWISRQHSKQQPTSQRFDMATLDDKLLGEKLQYYCSSSESEAEEDDDAGEKLQTSGGVAAPSAATSASSYQWRGSSSNVNENLRILLQL